MGGGRPRASTSGRAATRTFQDASTLPSFPRFPSVIPAQAGTTHPFPNSSLPPFRGLLQNGRFWRIRRSGSIWSALAHMRQIRCFAGDSFRGEVRWGVGGPERPPAAESGNPHPPRRIHTPVIPAQAGTRAPPPSFLRRQEPALPLRHSCAGRNPRTLSPSFPRSPSVIPAQAGTRAPPPSFLRRQEPALPLRHSCAGRNPRTLSPSFPRSPSVIPAQAGTTHPFPNSSLPPFRGEVRWGVGGPERPPAAESGNPHPPRRIHTPVIPAPLSVIPAQAGTRDERSYHEDAPLV